MVTRSESAVVGTAGTLARWQELTRVFALDSTSMSLHGRISQLLVDFIECGELAVSDRLSAERELAELLGVSLAPVRQATLDAVNKGPLERRGDCGTFVLDPGLDQKISILHSFTESMRAEHFEVDTPVLRQQQVSMPPGVAHGCFSTPTQQAIASAACKTPARFVTASSAIAITNTGTLGWAVHPGLGPLRHNTEIRARQTATSAASPTRFRHRWPGSPHSHKPTQ